MSGFLSFSSLSYHYIFCALIIPYKYGLAGKIFFPTVPEKKMGFLSSLVYNKEHNDTITRQCMKAAMSERNYHI